MSLKVETEDGELYFFIELGDETRIRMNFPPSSSKWKKLLSSIEENFDYKAVFCQVEGQSSIEHSNGVVDFSVEKSGVGYQEICVSIRASHCVEAFKIFLERSRLDSC